MKTQTGSCAGSTDVKRVLIAGGGYAGTTCAVTLARMLRGRDDIEILLVEPDPCQQALSELDLVAVGPPRPQFCELWHPTVFRDLPVTVCYNRIAHIDPERHLVRIGDGDGEEVPYWRLVIATGAIPFMPRVPGLSDNAVTMWSVEDAQELQQRVDRAFKNAARTASAEERRRILSFVVIGGGATGVEIIGTMAQMLPRRMAEQGLAPDELSVMLVEGRPQILYDLPDKQRARAVERLERMGAEVITGEMVEWVDESSIRLSSGRTLDATVVVFCGGAQADPHATEWGFETDNAGRIIVGENLKTPDFDDVYVIGDVSSFRNPVTNSVLPMLAQMAIQQGPHAAKNLYAEIEGRKPIAFTPHMRGEFVSVGPRWGVGWMYSLNLTGFPAIVMKRVTYVKYWLQVGGVPLAWKRLREMLGMGW